MRYMLLVYTRENAGERTPAEQQEIMNAHFAVIQDASANGVFEGAEPLAGTSTATTVRIQNGKPLITDGPFAETREQLAGYYILNCNDLDEAIAYAARIPTGCGGRNGCIEIRPLPGLPKHEDAIKEVVTASSNG